MSVNGEEKKKDFWGTNYQHNHHRSHSDRTTQGHRSRNTCPLCPRSLKTGIEKEIRKKKEKTQEELDEEIWIHKSSLIHAVKQSQPWTESRGIYWKTSRILNQWKTPLYSWEDFNTSSQTSALLLRISGQIIKPIIFKQQRLFRSVQSARPCRASLPFSSVWTLLCSGTDTLRGPGMWPQWKMFESVNSDLYTRPAVE